MDKHFIHEGVVRVDPDAYLRRYCAEIDTWHSRNPHARLDEESTHAAPPPPRSPSPVHVTYPDRYYRAASPYITEIYDRPRIVPPIPRSSSYHYGYYDSPDYYLDRPSTRYRYDLPNHYCNQSSSRYYSDRPSHYCNRSYSRYYDYADDDDIYRSLYCDSYEPRAPSRSRYYRSSSYDPYYSPSSVYDAYCRSSSYYPSETIRVHSDGEFRRVICDLTDGRAPYFLGQY